MTKAVSAVGGFAKGLFNFGGSILSSGISAVNSLGFSAGDFLQGYSTLEAMDAAERLGASRAEELTYNAAVVQEQVELERDWATAEALRLRRRAKLDRGEVTASFAASGVVANTGSVLDVLYDDTIEAVLDQQTVLAQGEIRAQYLEKQAGLFQLQAKNVQKNAKDTVLAQALDGFGGILTRRL